MLHDDSYLEVHYQQGRAELSTQKAQPVLHSLEWETRRLLESGSVEGGARRPLLTKGSRTHVEHHLERSTSCNRVPFFFAHQVFSRRHKIAFKKNQTSPSSGNMVVCQPKGGIVWVPEMK